MASSAVPSSLLLFKLLEACAKHKRKHDRNQETPIDWCQAELASFASILPRMESSVAVNDSSRDDYCCFGADQGTESSSGQDFLAQSDSTTNDAIDHLCALYRAIARGSFCPNAVSTLFAVEGQYDQENNVPSRDIARGVMPRIMNLLRFVATDPVKVATVELKETLSPRLTPMSEAIGTSKHDEGFGPTIAALLNSFQSEHTNLMAVRDLLNLSDDLNLVDESNTLFDPSQSSRHEATRNKEHKIRIQVFREIIQFCRNDEAFDNTIQFSSRRSLLGLQCIVWAVLGQLIPLLDDKSWRDGTAFLQDLKSSIMTTVVMCHQPTNLGTGGSWDYSARDIALQSLLVLRIKLAVVKLMEMSFTRGRREDVAMLATGITKAHLEWIEFLQSTNANIHYSRSSHCQDMEARCSWTISSFVANTVVAPNCTDSERSEIWRHVFPELIQCIPAASRLPNKCDNLRRMVVRAVHAILSSESDANRSYFAKYFVSRGNSFQLAKLIRDPAMYISGPAISILVILLESSPKQACLRGDEVASFAVETACSEALQEIKAERSNLEADNESSVARLGSKRRKLISDGQHSNDAMLGLHAAFSHTIISAASDGSEIIATLESSKGGSTSRRSSNDPLLTTTVVDMLRNVVAILRVIIACSSSCQVGNTSTSRVFSSLLRSVGCIADTIASPLNPLAHNDASLVQDALDLIVSVGADLSFYQDRAVESAPSVEAISNCAIEAIQFVKFDYDEANPGYRLSKGVLGSAIPLLHVQVVNIDQLMDGGTDSRLVSECSRFALNESLPLALRCIGLAAELPIQALSRTYEPTLTSIRRILANASNSEDCLHIKSALLLLPRLFLSLTPRRENGFDADAAKHFITLLETFPLGSLVMPYINSKESKRLKLCATVCLTQLARLYAAAAAVSESKVPPPTANEYFQLSYDIRSLYLRKQSHLANSFGQLTAVTSMDNQVLSILGSGFFLEGNSNPCFDTGDTPDQWLANTLHLHTMLQVAPDTMLQASRMADFFHDHSHQDIYRLIACSTDDLNANLSTLHPPALMILLPFICPDKATQLVAADELGLTLMGQNMKVFNAFFCRAGSMNERVAAIFLEICFVIRQFCEVSSGTLVSRELVDVSRSEKQSQTTDVKIAMKVFESLCLAAPLSHGPGISVFRRAFQSLIRLWVAYSGDEVSTKTAVLTSEGLSLASASFDSIRTVVWTRKQHVSPIVSGMMATILTEFLLPPNQSAISAKARYRLLSVFISELLLPFSSSPLSTGSELPNILGIMNYVDETFPSAVADMIEREDHQAIVMCAAFRMYLVKDVKRLKKEEARMKKKTTTEVVVGYRPQEKSNPHIRSLVPGLKVSTSKLEQNAQMLCMKTEVLAYVLPRLLLNPSLGPLRFYAHRVCKTMSFRGIMEEIGLSVLKALVWELGNDDANEDSGDEMYDEQRESGTSVSRDNVRLALARAYVLNEGGEFEKEVGQLLAIDGSADDVPCELAGRWVAPNFMFLLVNIILHQWKRRSSRDKFQVIKTLRVMLHYLPPGDLLKYTPQIMTAINSSLSACTSASGEDLKLRYMTVVTLFDFVKIVASEDASQISVDLTQIVVALFPLFNDEVYGHNDLARKKGVNMLEWLVEGDLAECFRDIPFLPSTTDLQRIRSSLKAKGLQLDGESPADEAQLEARINVLSDLMTTHENKNVRKVVLSHLSELIHANRGIFQKMVANEESSSMNFLTVVHNSSFVPAGETAGAITRLISRLLGRCVDETDDKDVRDALATCLGEIGAIDPNRLDKDISSLHFGSDLPGSDDGGHFILSNPPWKTNVTEFEFHVLTRHLVNALRSAPSTLDQHKISFSIQELLRMIDSQIDGLIKADGAPMSSAFRERLIQADAITTVEPFWNTSYMQVDIDEKSPPFLPRSTSYYQWISSFCRFLISRSHSNNKNAWGAFFHACRSAIRSLSGIVMAEFLLPLFVLDLLCFGNKSDEEIIVEELVRVLSFDTQGDQNHDGMRLEEREKAVLVVFGLMSILRQWSDNETEALHRMSLSKGAKKRMATSSYSSSWSHTLCLKKIDLLLSKLPLPTCAEAASSVGMRARALQFLEMEGRRLSNLRRIDNSTNPSASNLPDKFIASNVLEGIDLQLTQTLLGQLNDFDSMLVVSQESCHEVDHCKRLAETALEKELYEDWEGACQAYEQLLDKRLNKGMESYTKYRAQAGLLRCLLKLGRLESVLNQSYGMTRQAQPLQSPPDSANEHTLEEVSTEFLPCATEAAWRLGNWEVLDSLVGNGGPVGPFDEAGGRSQISFSRTMHAIQSRSHDDVVSCLKDAREDAMVSLTSACRDGYLRSYPHLMTLHSLREIEHFSKTFSLVEERGSQRESTRDIASNDWKSRLDLSVLDANGSNSVINARLALSRLADQPQIEGDLWLDIGKKARKANQYQFAEQSLTQANVAFCRISCENNQKVAIGPKIGDVRLQLSKLKHAMGERTAALKLVEDDIPSAIFCVDERDSLGTILSGSTRSKDIISRNILQSTLWMASGDLKNEIEIIDRYKTVLKLSPTWERAHFHFARYLDSLFQSSVDSDDRVEHLIQAIDHYGAALNLGVKHLFQSLPRLLTMWLEFTSLGNKDAKSSCHDACLQENQDRLNTMMKSFASSIPAHMFYTALPQLVSSVLHPDAESRRNVSLILRTVLVNYPAHSLWSIGWLRQSKSEDKSKAGSDIFRGATKLLRKTENGKHYQNLLSGSGHLFNFLIQLAKYNPKATNAAPTTVRMNVPRFQPELKHYIPPVQAALSLSPGSLKAFSASSDVFPSFVPRMRAFNPQIRVMQSKARPKKIGAFAVPSAVALEGDSLPITDHSLPMDSGEMHFLVKLEAKGDLRKDARVQDLNNVVNRIFKDRKGSKSRRQRLRLQLRTFQVVCLAEDSGILEWVPSTDSLRSVITSTFNPLMPGDSIHRRGRRVTDFSDADLRNAFLKCQEVFFKRDEPLLAVRKFDELVLQKYLPVFYWWFVQNFSSPHAWFEARNKFTLSAAVWSAVGHILIGLGDRHSENILIDTRNGECVHVDFDCIFDKGLLLPRPEVIPFRLTPNMIDAFGPTGAKGLYTGALIEATRTIRCNSDVLLAVLEAFIKDPVIQGSKSKKTKEGKDVRGAEASIAKIRNRLEGQYNLRNPNKLKGKSASKIPDKAYEAKLSVEGQVQKMIAEATSLENLVQVYVGWMPWV